MSKLVDYKLTSRSNSMSDKKVKKIGRQGADFLYGSLGCPTVKYHSDGLWNIKLTSVTTGRVFI